MTTRRPTTITRRSLLMAGAAVPLCGILTRRASAAEFSYKLATGQDPTHPVNVRGQEAIDRIREATGGRLEIKLFPANQLGSDTELLTQVRNGGVEFFNQSSSILATFVPAAGIVNTGFAFTNYESVWQGMDGELGAYIRAQIAKTPIMTISKVWDNGFRQITSSGREIRTPDERFIRRSRPRSSMDKKIRCRSLRQQGCTKCRSPAASPVMYGMAIGFSATNAPSSVSRRTCRRS
jgi:TRAP-type C4-dicarboxylate transport system substrate-binding protein